MAESEGLEEDHLVGGSFSQLLLSDDFVGLDTIDQAFTFYPSSYPKPPKMLCFGLSQQDEPLVSEITTRTTPATPKKSGITCSDSSSASSGNNTNINKKRNGSAEENKIVTQRTAKKSKSDYPAKRKEKLGERILALQQLVSPFGKTDTASVLHEAMGYIRFLHEQVGVLCSPYLQGELPLLTSSSTKLSSGGENRGVTDMRSRGLCLVPVECTVNVAESNGADFWSPAMGRKV